MGLEHLRVFDSETERTIAPRIPEQIIVDAEVAGNKLQMLGAKIALPQAINAEAGKYEVVIPTDAVRLGKTIPATVITEENINGARLVHLQVADRVLFAIVDKDEALEAGKAVKIDIDLKQITLEQNNEVIVAPLALTNILPAKLCKEKIVVEKEVNGRTKKVKDLAFYLEIAGHKFDCPRALALRLINGGGKSEAKRS